jgi:hypothetical protein
VIPPLRVPRRGAPPAPSGPAPSSPAPSGSAGAGGRARVALVAAVILGGLASGCATTYDETLSTTATTAPATTTTLPSGTAVELLPVLRDDAATLSAEMIDEFGEPRAVVERMRAVWDVVAAEVGRARPDLVPGFDQNLALAERAVQYKRAADADKASRNIDALVDAFTS